MNREEILEKSRKENKNQDVYEKEMLILDIGTNGEIFDVTFGLYAAEELKASTDPTVSPLASRIIAAAQALKE